MSFGGLVTHGGWNSAALFNQKANHAMSGSAMAALSSTQKKQGMQILCTVTESGFIANHLYVMNATETAWIDVGLITHNHTSASDGGTYYNILRYSSGFVNLIENLAPRSPFFHLSTGSGGTITDSTGNGVTLSTNTTSGGNATASLAGSPVTHSFPSHFKVRLRCTSSTNLTACRIGIRSEAATEANTTLSKYLMEACSSSGSNWLIGSSDGTTRSTVSTSQAVATGIHDSYTLDHIISAIHAVKSTATSMAVKSSNVPTDIVNGGTQVFRLGLMNTAAENKELYLLSIRILGFSEHAGWTATTPLT